MKWRTRSLRDLRESSVGRWLIVGVIFTFIGTPLLWIVHGRLDIALSVATVIVGELTVLPRFFVNDRWVFGRPSPTWLRLWQFHVASAGGFAVWWAVSNALPHFKVEYLIASLVGTGCSVMLSLATNFLWIWRRRMAEEVVLQS